MTTKADDVSRETRAKLVRFQELLNVWNSKINLVSSGTLDVYQERHVNDGIFLYNLAPSAGNWLDLGSGGGIPGLMVAVLSAGRGSIALVESDSRKCAFLRAARRELALDVEIHESRIENLTPQAADVISARAVAPLPALLGLAYRHQHDRTEHLLLKGETWQREVFDARRAWSFDLDVVKSPGRTGSVVLKIRNLNRARI